VQPGVIVSASCIAFMLRRAYPYPDLHDYANLFHCTECKVQICEHAAQSVDRGRRIRPSDLLGIYFRYSSSYSRGCGRLGVALAFNLDLLDGISSLDRGPVQPRTSAGTQGKIGP
jgi:hypothetical protein